MKRILRLTLYLAIASLLVTGLLLSALFFVQPKRYQAFIEQNLISAAQDHGIVLRIGGSELTPAQFTAYNLQLLFPRAFFGLDVERLWVAPSLLSFFSAHPQVQGEALIYRGKLRADTGLSWQSGLQSATLRADGIHITEHPVIAGFGLRDGTLRGEVENARFDARGMESGEIELVIEGLNKPQATSFPLQQFGLPFKLDLPAFENLGIQAQAHFTRPAIEIKHFLSESSLATVRGTARLELSPSGRIRRWRVDGTTELTPAGQAFFGQYVVLLSGGSLDQSTQRFRFTTQGPDNLSSRFSRY